MTASDTWDRQSAPEGSVDLLAAMESLRLDAYRDSEGNPTIAFGSRTMPNGQPVKMGDDVTQAQALAMLERDIEGWCAASITRAVASPLTQAQACALTSFAYNIGPNALPGSTLAAMLLASQTERAARQFNGWCDAGGKPDLGLMRRRECERRMFLGAPLQPTRMQVWALSEAVLLPLYEAATADAVRWRDAPVAPAAPTETTDDLNAASAAGTLDIGADS